MAGVDEVAKIFGSFHKNSFGTALFTKHSLQIMLKI